MRQDRAVYASIWVTALAATFTVGSAISEPAIANQKSYTSARDCMRSVTKAENELNKAGEEADRLLNQARDLCMQTRYDRVKEILSKVEGTSDTE